LISLPKLDGSAQKTKWGKALVEGPQTQFVQIWPVDASQLPSNGFVSVWRRPGWQQVLMQWN
jgi:hypothetical protein